MSNESDDWRDQQVKERLVALSATQLRERYVQEFKARVDEVKKLAEVAGLYPTDNAVMIAVQLELLNKRLLDLEMALHRRNTIR